MLDRISASLGNMGIDTGEPSPSSEVADTPGTETGEQTSVSDGLADFEWEGAQLRLPKSAAEVLEKAANLDKGFTQKMQEVSDHRKALEQLQAVTQAQQAEIAFTNSIATEQQDLNLIDQYLKQFAATDFSKVPAEQGMRQMFEVAQIRDRRAALVQTINEKRAQFSNALQTRLQELRGKSREQVSKSIDNFSEDTERTIRDYAKSEGLTEREIDNMLLDPRAFRLAWKASQFDKVRADAKGGKQTPDADGVLRPGVAGERMSRETAQKLNFGKAMKAAKTSQQKAVVIEDRLGRVFKGHK